MSATIYKSVECCGYVVFHRPQEFTGIRVYPQQSVGKSVGKLTALQVRNAKPGKHMDGGGLFLIVGEHGAKSWILRMQHAGKRRDYGLGSLRDVSLSEAREAATAVRKMVLSGIDPVAEKKKEAMPTFREAAHMVYAEIFSTWKNKKHGEQWISSLENHTFADLGDMLVGDIDTGHIRDCLVKIWLTVPETARRVRQRIGTVLDFAHVKGWRQAEAPMRAVSRGLPKQPKGVSHHEALPWAEVPKFVARMPEMLGANDVSRLAMEFIILTATRTGEGRGAVWSEFDIDDRLWTIPKERMKMDRPHRIPLADRCLAILEEMKEYRVTTARSALVFPGAKAGRPISNVTLTMQLRRAGLSFTMHGFRSSFRDWCAEATETPDEVAEACLAHIVKGKAKAAYLRTDHLEKRRSVMEEWAAFVTGYKPDE